MPTSRSRSHPVPADEELRLPRPPGVIRRFWARHPLFADILIMLACLLLSLGPAASFQPPPVDGGSAASVATGFAAASLSLAIIAACLLLLRRRRWPLVAFVGSLAVAGIALLAAVPLATPLLLVTTYSVAVYRSSRACWTGLGIGLGALTVLSIVLSGAGVVSFQASSNAVLAQLVFGLIGALIGVNVGNRRRYLQAVIDRSRQLLVERDQQAQIAAATERERIAREMHDIVSHSLTVVVALSEGAAATSDQERARSAMDAAAATARGALTEMRAMLGVLRAGGSDAPLTPLAPIAPHDTVAAAQRAGYPVTITVTGEPAVPPLVAHAVGRIVQEGVTNAMRHAPAATAIAVRVDYAARPLVVEIVNDGVRPRAGAPGFGLQGLRERAAHLGGTVESGPAGGGRWTLRAQLPVDADLTAAGALRAGMGAR